MLYLLILPAIAITVTLCYASVLDVRERRVPFRTWYPMLAVSIPFTALFYGSLVFVGNSMTAVSYAVLALLFSAVFYSFAYFRLFGGADAWALIFICLCLPAFPFPPLLGVPPLGFLPFSVIANAVILNLVTPAAIFLYNLRAGNRAPWPYMFLGFPVDGERISEAYGFVMEEIGEDDGIIHRRFLGITEALRGMMSGSGRIYTLDLRRRPEEYGDLRALYARAGNVWISYGVPFILPITAGVISALLIGDLIAGLLGVLNGI